MRVGVIAAGVPANVAVEVRADMPELVQDGNQLLAKIEILESWQVKAEDIEHFAAAQIGDRLNAHLPAAADRDRAAAGKPERRERGEDAVGHGLAGLAKADGDPLHVDMRQVG